MAIAIRDDDRITFRIFMRDDDTGRNIMPVTTIDNGGTGRDKTSDGPGVVVQQDVGGNLATITMARGDVIWYDGNNVVVLPGNDSATRKFLLSRALVAGQPAPEYDTLSANDIASGELAMEHGGLGFDATVGAGVLRKVLPAGLIQFSDTLSLDTLDVVTLNVSSIVAASIVTSGLVSSSGFEATAGGSAGTPAYGSPRLIHTGGVPAMSASDGTNATPSATEFYIAEIAVEYSVAVSGIAIFNGSVASGNLKVGIALSSGVVIAQSLSTAMAGTDTYQRIPMPVNLLGPAVYYALLFVDNATARINCHPIGTFGTSKKTGQVYATGFTAITPPTTFTADVGPIMTLY